MAVQEVDGRRYLLSAIAILTPRYSLQKGKRCQEPFSLFKLKKVPPGRSGGCPPELPQIRTCPIKASGSSGHGLAAHGGAPARDPLLVRGHGSRFQCTGHVSLQRLRNAAPPSLHRVLAGGVPRLRRYYEALRFPAAVSPRFVVLRVAIPPCAPLFAPTRQCAYPADRGLGIRFPFRNGMTESAGRPRFLGSLLHLCPILGPRRDRHASP